MNANPSRRALLVGAGAVLALPGVTAPATASPGPDAALIALCSEHIVNFHAFNTSGAEPDGGGPLEAAYLRTYRLIGETEPQTLAGTVAFAKVIKLEATLPSGEERPGDVTDWAYDLVCDLLRLHGAAA